MHSILLDSITSVCCLYVLFLVMDGKNGRVSSIRTNILYRVFLYLHNEGMHHHLLGTILPLSKTRKDGVLEDILFNTRAAYNLLRR